MPLSDEAFAELRAEWNRALPGIIEGRPDRTDLMIPIYRIVDRRVLVTVGKIREAVSKETGVMLRMVDGVRQTQRVCRARHMITYIVRKLAPDHGHDEIGFMIGRDRTTVTNSLKRAEFLLQNDRPFMAQYGRVMERLGPAALD